jgi:thioredoxin 1
MSRDKQYASYKSLAPKEEKPEYKCVEIQDLHHKKNILSTNKIVCIDLFADWCNPCKIVSPKFAELANQYNNPGHCMLVKENVDLGLTTDYNITSIPAFIFYKQGQLLRNQDSSPVSVVGGDLAIVKKILDKLILES